MKKKNKKKIMIDVKIPIEIFQDENNIWFAYNNKFHISGYSESKKNALKMFHDSVLDVLKWTKQHD